MDYTAENIFQSVAYIKWNLTASGFQGKFTKGGKEKTKMKSLDKKINKILAY